MSNNQSAFIADGIGSVTKMKNLAIIPARGGSKRILHKNVKQFLGKPIIAYSIETALASGLFDEVMVSTDDDRVAEIAQQYGAKIPFLRSQATANDHAGLAEVIDEVILEYEKSGYQFDNFCCILATSPFITAQLLTDCYELLVNNVADTIRPIVKFPYPIQRSFYLKESGQIDWNYPEYKTARSQDLTEAYHDSGMFYWGHVSIGLNSESRGAVVISEMDCHDIDTVEDWDIAELKYKLRR